MSTSKAITTINTNESEDLSIGGGSYGIFVLGEQTGGNYAVIDMLVPPGAGPGRMYMRKYKKCLCSRRRSNL